MILAACAPNWVLAEEKEDQEERDPMRTIQKAAVAAGAVLCAGTALADMQNITYRLVGTNMVDTGGFNWTVDVIAVLDEGDRLDAVAGNSANQKVISSSGGVLSELFLRRDIG